MAVALLSTGFGASADHTHPVLQVMASMVLTVLGVWVVMAIRPFEREATILPAGEGAARVDYILRSQVALLSMGAALIHFAVIKEHLAEYWLYGVFFVVVALAQMAWAIWVARRPARMLLIAGAVGNSLVAGTWVLTRTVGALVGPAAHEKATVGFGDTVSTGFEVLIAVGAIVLLRRDWTSRPHRHPSGEHPDPAGRHVHRPRSLLHRGELSVHPSRGVGPPQRGRMAPSSRR